MRKHFLKIWAIIFVISFGLMHQTFAQWNLTGNGNATTTSILGTTNSTPLRLFTKNTPRLVIDTLGRVGIGITVPTTQLMVRGSGGNPSAVWTNIGKPVFGGFGETNVGNADFILGMASSTLYNAIPRFAGRRSRGTLAAPTAVMMGDQLMSFSAFGYDGTTFQNPAAIEFSVDGLPAGTGVPTSISMATGNNGVTRAERLKVGSNGNIIFNAGQLYLDNATGNIGIGTTNPTARLEINGQIKITGGIPPTAGSVLTTDATGLAYWGSPSGVSQWTVSGNNIYAGNSGNVGIGNTNPIRAKLEVNGVAGSGTTSAIFGGDGTGISIQRNWPTIGFNQYRDVPTGNGKAIGNGYGVQVNMDPAIGAFSINMQDSVGANQSFANTPVRGISIFKNGFVHLGNNNITDQASLSISGSSAFPSHFNFGTDGHTYIRGGNKFFGGFGVYANRRPSKVYINDQPGELFGSGTSKPGGDVVMVTGGGNVGIGVDNPTSPLSFPNILGNKISFWNAGSTADFGIGIQTGTMQFYTAGQDQFAFGYGNSANFIQTMTYYPGTAQLGINCLPQVGYNLAINGKVRAKEIRIETGWADYVFDEDYKLRSLKEVEDFIKTNKHLPDVTPGSEIETNGLEVGKTSAQMIKKIEELTLYVIDQEKAINSLKEHNAKLEAAINLLIEKGGK